MRDNDDPTPIRKLLAEGMRRGPAKLDTIEALEELLADRSLAEHRRAHYSQRLAALRHKHAQAQHASTLTAEQIVAQIPREFG